MLAYTAFNRPWTGLTARRVLPNFVGWGCHASNVPKRTNPFQQVIASLVDLLENGSVVTESIEYPDPAAGNPREVDITVVRGHLNGNPVKIGIECTELGRKATQPWVEQQYGKHSRLKVVDFVVLVSGSGFSKTARAVAEDLGYLAVHPNIGESELGAAVNERIGGGVRVRVSSMRILNCDFNCTLPIPSSDGYAFADDTEDAWLYRADGSQLVQWNEFKHNAVRAEYMKDAASYMAMDEGSTEQFTVELNSPTHEGERIHARFTDGESEVLATVDRMEISVSVVSTNAANMKLTHMGNFDGHAFATGQAPIGDTKAVIVATDVGGQGRYQVRFNFDADKGHPPRQVPKKRGKESK